MCTPLPKNYIYEVSVEWKMIAWYEILPVYGNRKNKVYSFHQIYFYPTFIRIKGSVREKWKWVHAYGAFDRYLSYFYLFRL